MEKRGDRGMREIRKEKERERRVVRRGEEKMERI